MYPLNIIYFSFLYLHHFFPFKASFTPNVILSPSSMNLLRKNSAKNLSFSSP